MAALVLIFLQIVVWIVTLGPVTPRLATVMPEPPTSLGPGSLEPPREGVAMSEFRAGLARLLKLRAGPLAPSAAQRRALTRLSPDEVERVLAVLTPAQRRFVVAR